MNSDIWFALTGRPTLIHDNRSILENYNSIEPDDNSWEEFSVHHLSSNNDKDNNDNNECFSNLENKKRFIHPYSEF